MHPFCLRSSNPSNMVSYDNHSLHRPAAFQNMKNFYWLLIVLLSVGQIESVQAAPALPSGKEPRFPKPVEEYYDVQRIQAEPFNLVGTLIFLGAIIHIFVIVFMAMAS